MAQTISSSDILDRVILTLGNEKLLTGSEIAAKVKIPLAILLKSINAAIDKTSMFIKNEDKGTLKYAVNISDQNVQQILNKNNINQIATKTEKVTKQKLENIEKPIETKTPTKSSSINNIVLSLIDEVPISENELLTKDELAELNSDDIINATKTLIDNGKILQSRLFGLVHYEKVKEDDDISSTTSPLAIEETELPTEIKDFLKEDDDLNSIMSHQLQEKTELPTEINKFLQEEDELNSILSSQIKNENEIPLEIIDILKEDDNLTISLEENKETALPVEINNFLKEDDDISSIISPEGTNKEVKQQTNPETKTNQNDTEKTEIKQTDTSKNTELLQNINNLLDETLNNNISLSMEKSSSAFDNITEVANYVKSLEDEVHKLKTVLLGMQESINKTLS